MGRGGIAARKALAERIERAQRYRLIGIRAGSLVAECLDKYGRWELGHRRGSIVRLNAEVVQIHWHGDTELTHYSQGDARYSVDRGFWRIVPPSQRNVFDALRSTLTGEAESASIMPSPHTGVGETEEETEVTTKTEKAAPEQPTEEKKTFSAKQVASRIGTDAKTLRKFFRSAKSPYKPVGQGGRYEFDAELLPEIKDRFVAWQNGKAPKTEGANDLTGKGPRKAPAKKTKLVVPEVVEEDDEVVFEDEPSEEDLTDIEDLSFEDLDGDED